MSSLSQALTARVFRMNLESMKHDQTWGELAEAVEEWVSIGFETIVNWSSGWKNSGTVNQLYRAAYRALLNGEFPMRHGEEFARTVGSMVASRRRSEH